MKLDTKLVDAVATLFCQEAATHPDFMFALAEVMAKRNYCIEAHQRGVQGTWLCVVKTQPA